MKLRELKLRDVVRVFEKTLSNDNAVCDATSMRSSSGFESISIHFIPCHFILHVPKV